MIIWPFLIGIAGRALGRFATPELARALAGGAVVVVILIGLTIVYWRIEASGYARRDREVQEALARKNAEIAAAMEQVRTLSDKLEREREAAMTAALAGLPVATGQANHLPEDLRIKLNRIR